MRDAFVRFMMDPNIQSFLINLGSSISWDAIKTAMQKVGKDETIEFQAYQVIKETFETFYLKLDLEFDEDCVMNAFFETVKNIDDFSSETITTEMICDTTGINHRQHEIKEWIKIFTNTCSNPRFQWVYNRLFLSSMKICGETRGAQQWMGNYMSDNYCKLQCDITDELLTIFDDIKTHLSQECWYDTRVLIGEIILNAQEHGKAQKCMLYIDKNKITILDNGRQFNPLMLEEQSYQAGGSIAMKKYMLDHPQISLKSEYYGNYNRFILEFEKDVFDVNSMSEIIVQNLFSREKQYRLKHLSGKFKYYYIDMDEIPRQEDELIIASYSGICSLFSGLKRSIAQEEGGKIFVYFSDMTRIDYQMVFKQMEIVLKNYMFDTGGIEIELVTDNDISVL